MHTGCVCVLIGNKRKAIQENVHKWLVRNGMLLLEVMEVKNKKYKGSR